MQLKTATEALAAEATKAALCLIAMKDMASASLGFGDAYRQAGVDYSLRACEIAARLTGVEPFYAKMLNHKFRTGAAEMMFERALAEVRS